MQERISPKAAQYHFDSLAELARYLDTAPVTWRGANESKSNKPTRSWDLNAGYEKAWELARYGWNEGAGKAQQALKALSQASAKPDKQNDFYGHMPHVPRYCAGAPDCMIRYSDRTNQGRVLTLIVPVNALANVDAKYMSNFGVGIANWINQLEAQGIRCEVWGALCSQVSGWRVTHTWTIKRADQPLDLAVLAFAVGHPAMFRRLGFALRERCAAPRDFGYGKSDYVALADVINPPVGAYVINGMKDANSTACTPEEAVKYIGKQIEKALEDANT